MTKPKQFSFGLAKFVVGI